MDELASANATRDRSGHSRRVIPDKRHRRHPSEAGEPAVIPLLHDEASELSLSRTPMAAPSRPAEQAGSEHFRQSTMAILVAASAAELAAAEAAIGPLPGFRHLRRPEAGLLMLRGRIGGEGARFNVGEATVTRCLVVTEAGTEGAAYHLGRDLDRFRA